MKDKFNAYVYEIDICESTLSYVHGFTRTIREVCIESKDFCACINREFVFFLTKENLEARLKDVKNKRPYPINIKTYNKILKLKELNDLEEQVKMELQLNTEL